MPLKRRLMAALPHVGLFTFLAQTEAGFIAGLRPEEQEARPHSTGRPILGVEIRAVDANGEDVPVGEPGELLVRCGEPGRAAVMREYFRNPEATAAAFLGEWFRTGDVGYFDGDGFLYFVDRAKDMIVTGGLNVYSKEVEIALLEHEAVADAAVVGVPDDAFRRGGRGLRGAGAGRRRRRRGVDRALPGAHRELQEAQTRPFRRRPAAHRHRQGGQAGAQATPGDVHGHVRGARLFSRFPTPTCQWDREIYG